MKSLILSAIVVITVFITSCNSANTSDTKSVDSTQIQKSGITYTCPMHPEVISDKPGKCPKCKMDLVQKGKENTEDHSGHQH